MTDYLKQGLDELYNIIQSHIIISDVINVDVDQHYDDVNDWIYMYDQIFGVVVFVTLFYWLFICMIIGLLIAI